MFILDEIVSYLEMCTEEQTSLQRGMNYRLPSGRTVILMSRRPNAPYTDRIEDAGRTIVYEGHDLPKSVNLRDPKTVDQEASTPSGKLTQNGKFERAALQFRSGSREAETITVYEKLRMGVWVFNGEFRLADTWREESAGRQVFKFRLELQSASTEGVGNTAGPDRELEHNRVIPSAVKVEVYKRDRGQCVQCGAKNNLHFDHILPFSRGGTSLRTENIQLLCARHNLEKAARIE
jgi:hypothetical protein